MTLQEIQSKVDAAASARLPEVVGRVFATMRNQHTHNSWRGECWCDYCVFIRGEYVDAKMALHAIKKRLRYLEWVCTDTEIHTMNRWYEQEGLQKWKCWELKQQKKALKEEVI